MRLTARTQPPVAAPEGDVIEFDGLCLRQPPPLWCYLWVWVGASRLTRQALGCAPGARVDGTLSRAWAQVPAD